VSASISSAGLDRDLRVRPVESEQPGATGCHKSGKQADRDDREDMMETPSSSLCCFGWTAHLIPRSLPSPDFKLKQDDGGRMAGRRKERGGPK
jgi:hypothetical protein